MTQNYNIFHMIALKHSPEIQSSYLDYCDANQFCSLNTSLLAAARFLEPLVTIFRDKGLNDNPIKNGLAP